MVTRAAWLATLLAAAPAAAFCPSYTLSSSANANHCGVEAANGTNPEVAAWPPLFTFIGRGSWGAQGPALAPIPAGCGKPTAPTSVPALFPCELVEAIAMQESGWRQFCVPDQPADQAHPPERTIIAVDCGYGVGQVTSGMHEGETPAFDRARVAADPTYNLATSALIFADKWRATACVGDRQPRTVEDWYVAVWAYNSLSFVNNPNNPNYDAARGPCDPNGDCGARPYQERVWGWMEHPPTPQHWTPLAPAYPALADLPATGATLPALPEPACASPTSCATSRPTHASACLGSSAPADAGPSDGGSSAGAPGGCACALHRATVAGAPDARFALLALMALAASLRYKRRP